MNRARLAVERLHQGARRHDRAALTAFELACNGLDTQELLVELSARFVDVAIDVARLRDTIERLHALIGNNPQP